MKLDRHNYLVISLCALILLLSVFFWKQWQARTQTEARLSQAKTNINNVGEIFRTSLEPDFVITEKQTVSSGCEEESPGLSFTRLYDCNATTSFTLSSTPGIAVDRAKSLMRTALNELGVAAGTPEELDQYVDFITATNFWQTLQPFSVPHTRIAGVPPFNYYGGSGQEDVGLRLESEYYPDSKKITLRVTVIQEYHSCKSFFLPCAKAKAPAVEQE